jgi:transcriptional regulator with XRE-family HTH domain
MTPFGENLTLMLRKYNLTAKELGSSINVHVSGIQRIAEGRCLPSIDTAMSIVAFFGVSMDWMLGLEVDPKWEEPWGGLYYNHYRKEWQVWVRAKTRPRALGYYPTKELAIAAIKEHQNANAQREKDVHPGPGLRDGGPGPGLSRPADSDMGERLSRDEVAVPGRAETLPGCGKGVLS